MPKRWIRPSLLVARAVLVLLAALGPTHAAASSDAETEPPAADAITTVLHPGWNMVGWVGPSTPTSELFDEIASLRQVSAWDALAKEYRRARRDGHAPLPTLAPGMGLWLLLGGNASVEWTRPVSHEAVLLSLHAGLNLVGWTGENGTAIEDAVFRFGEAFVRASRWSAEAQEYLHYHRGATSLTATELQQGAALWVELAQDAGWWQAGAPLAHVDFTIPDGMPPEREANLRAGMASVVMFFAERYGIAPPEVSVVVDPDLWTIGVASPGTIRIAAGFVESEVLAEQVRGTLAHEYYHVLQFHLRQEGPGAGSSPAWITEGAATYAQDLYERAQSGGTAEAVHVGRWRHSLGVARPLRELESNGVFREEPESWAYSFGALAVEWLSGHAEAGPDGEFGPEDVGWTDRLDDDGAHLDYYRLLASGADWQEAFAIAFGLSPDEFYAEFEAYRAELGPRLLPHLADEVDEPVVSWSGRVSDATVSAARAELARIDLFHGERLEAGPADYTVHLAGGPDELASASRRMLGVELPASGCRWVSSADPPAAAIVIDASCRSLRTSDLADFHRRAIIGRLLPVERFFRGESSRGPYWLQMAIDSYATHHYEIVAGMRTLDEIRPEQVQLASRLRQPLRTLVRASDVLAAGYEEARALSFLAGEWLVDRAGEASLFEFYRGLQSGATWQEAFEAAFGIAAADFLDAFEAYRGGVSPAAAS